MAHTLGSAVDLDLVRVPGDRRLYALPGFGTLRLQGLLGRAALAQSDAGSWKLARRGFWQREVVATDEAGTICGSFDPRSIRRGGTLRFADRELTLRPVSSWRERYELVERERRLALLDGKGFGKRPVRVTIEDGGQARRRPAAVRGVHRARARGGRLGCLGPRERLQRSADDAIALRGRSVLYGITFFCT